MSIFDETKKIFLSKNFTLTNPYMVNRLLSFLPQTFVLSTLTNRYIGKIPRWAIYSIYKNCVPKYRGSGAPNLYYEGKKKKKEVILTQKVANHLCCSTKHAEETIATMRKCGHKPEEFFGLKKGE